MKLSIRYGMPFCTTECAHCGEEFSKCAYAQYSPYCEACDYAIKQEREFQIWLTKPPSFWPYWVL